MSSSRGMREQVVRAMAKVGLVWALFVLGAMFMAMSSQGHEPDGGYSLSRAGSVASFSVEPGTAPRTAGLALTLCVLGGGVTVLAVGAAREPRGRRAVQVQPDPAMDAPLALGLVFGGSGLA